MNKTTITINGRLYDAITGMPIADTPHTPAKKAGVPRQAAPQAPHRAFNDIGGPAKRPVTSTQRSVSKSTANSIHMRTQKSQTLNRKAIKKPQAPTLEATAKHSNLAPQAHRSPLIKKFADRATANNQIQQAVPKTPVSAIEKPQLHPSLAKMASHQNHPVANQQYHSGKHLKEMLIKERLAEVGEAPKKERHSWLSKKPKLVTILTSSLALLILGGYLTYMTLPSISMQVASSRAGVSATIPNYKPDGYGLNGPISYSPGEVVINYKSNTNTNGFQLTQKISNWDSQALLDNYVTKQTDNYLTFQERGLTIYTFGENAAWVNGGLLYTISGDAGLSSEQILRVATSM